MRRSRKNVIEKKKKGMGSVRKIPFKKGNACEKTKEKSGKIRKNREKARKNEQKRAKAKKNKNIGLR